MISSKSHNVQFQPVLGTGEYFLPVLGKHLPVKTGICRSSGGLTALQHMSIEVTTFMTAIVRIVNSNLLLDTE